MLITLIWTSTYRCCYSHRRCRCLVVGFDVKLAERHSGRPWPLTRALICDLDPVKIKPCGTQLNCRIIFGSDQMICLTNCQMILCALIYLGLFGVVLLKSIALLVFIFRALYWLRLLTFFWVLSSGDGGVTIFCR